MLQWLQNIANTVFSGLNSLRDWIVRAIAAVYSFIRAEINVIVREYNEFLDWVRDFSASVNQAVRRVWDYATWIAEHLIKDLITWINRRVQDISDFANWVYHQARKDIDYVLNFIETVRHDVILWVLQHIYNPIKAFIDGLFSWINDQINNIVKYFQHPELLVQLIAGWLWREWLNLVRQYSRPVAKWMLGHMLGLTVSIIHVIEDIITAIV